MLPANAGKAARKPSAGHLAARAIATLSATAIVAVLMCLPDAARAQGNGSQDEPVFLNADTVTYDENLQIVTASGAVELTQGNRILLADTVTYNQKSKIVTATGNVVVLEPTGEVIFADYSELTDDMREGFIENIRLLMTDGSRMAAPEGERTSRGRYTRLNHATYSPCNLCAEDPTRPPLWSVKAVRVVHDNEEKNVYYRDATLEMFGVPTFYTPFLSHPDPSVERRSGVLTPTFGLGGNIGAFLSVPYYWSIDQDKDLTLTPSYSSEDGPRMAAEYRQRFESGEIYLDSSLLQADRTETTDGQRRLRENQIRGHLFGNARFSLDDTWRAGGQIQRVTDETYLRRYGISNLSLLRSSAFVEGFRGRDYAGLSSYYFQDLRPGVTVDEPLILPLGEVSMLGAPNETFGGRWSLDLGILGLHRQRGTNVRRFASELGWERTFISSLGFVTTIAGSTRADIYQVELAGRLPGESDDQTLRLFPQAQATTRYPMLGNFGESVQAVVDPFVQLTTAPRIGDNPDIPNEESVALDLTETNLLRPSRYTGIDRLETGSRVTYGVEAGLFGQGGGFSDLFLGQSHRLTDDQEFPAGSGLEGRTSDIVGRLRIQPNAYLQSTYRFRLDEQDFTTRLSELTTSAGVRRLNGSVQYRYVGQVQGPNGFPSTETVAASLTSAINDNWTVSVAQSRDLMMREPVATVGTLSYSDECLIFQLVASRNHTYRDLEEGGTDAVFFRLIFKNLGEIEAPLLGGTSTTVETSY